MGTESSQTVKCHQTNQLVVVMMPSTPSSPRLVPASTSPALSSSISSPPLSMRSEPEPTDNFSIPSSSSQERRMPPTTSPEDITPLVRRLSISASTESESSPISALVSRVSSSSTPSVEVPDPVSDLSSSRDSPSITVRNPSSDSPSTPLPRSPPPLLNLTTPSSPPTLSSSTPMSPSCSTTRPSTISQKKPRHRETHLHQPQQTRRPGYLLFDRLPQIRWCPQRRYHRIPDQPRPLPQNSLHALLIRSRHLRREGLPRATLRSRDHQL